MRTLRAQLLLRMGKIEEAYQAALDIEEKHPSTNNKSMLANILLRKGDMEAAASMFESIIQIDPYMEHIWRGWLNTLFLSGRIPELDNAVQFAKLKIPESLVTQTFEGLTLFMRNDIPGAELILLQTLDTDPGQPFVNHTMGLIRRSQGMPNEAEQFLREEIRLNPPAVPARRTFVEILAEQKRYNEQLRQLRAIKRAEPPNPLTAHAIAQALFNMKRYDDSSKAVQACMQMDENYAGCALLWANILKKQGKDEDAQKAFDRAVKLRDQNPQSRRR